MREQRTAMEKELGSMQNKAQSNFQELQTMQIKVGAFLCFHMFFFSCCHGAYVRLKKQEFKNFANIKQSNNLLKIASVVVVVVV